MDGHRHPTQASHPLSGTDLAKRLAIWALRQFINGEPRPCPASGDKPGWGRPESLRHVGVAFDATLNEMARRGIGHIQLGAFDSLDLSKDEHRLLRALAAAQSGNDDLVDNYLYKLVLDREVRRGLAAAVTALAAALAASGYWLGDARPTRFLPSAALPVARLHGRAMIHAGVAWP